MQITLGNEMCQFRSWRPRDGRVFSGAYAMDTETTMIEKDRPWECPIIVLAAACNGERGYFVPPNHMLQFLQVHWDLPVVFHHAPFDLRVLEKLGLPDLDVYELVEQNRVWDIHLLHRLYTLATDGHTSSWKGQATLEHCAQRYLDLELPKQERDAEGNEIRTSWGQFLGRHPLYIKPAYLEYLAKDTLATFLVYEEVMARLDDLLANSDHVFGFVSSQGLKEQIDRWGPQTHHIQLRGAIVLDNVHARGIGIDVKARDERLAELSSLMEEYAARLRRRDYGPGKGSATRLQELIAECAKKHPSVEIPLTPSDRYSAKEETLASLARYDPFFKDLCVYRMARKLKETYLEKMGQARIHPSYDVLKVTGRTSSFGALNIQNLPRDNPKDPQSDPRIRRCFVPADDHIFFDADFKMIELVTLAQAVIRQFGQRSVMGEKINAGEDIHSFVAAQVMGTSPDQVADDDRRKGKTVNFGLPGTLGAESLSDYAAATFNVQMSVEEALLWKERWLDTFPEMRRFLDEGQFDTNYEIARFFNLIPSEFREAAGWSNYNTEDPQGQAKLGGMFVKALSSDNPQARSGWHYTPSVIEYLRCKARARAADLPKRVQKLFKKGIPNKALWKAVRNCFDRAGVFTLTGRLRAKATFPARHNTIFQGLAADGAKLALWGCGGLSIASSPSFTTKCCLKYRRAGIWRQWLRK